MIRAAFHPTGGSARIKLLLRCGLLALALCFGAAAHAQSFSINSPTTQWTVVPYPPGTTADFSQDQQTGQGEADIVGGLLPSFYTHFEPGNTLTNGTVYYRIRLASGGSNFSRAAFLGIDANADGKLDIFVGVDNSGASNSIFVWYAGNDLNISPSTTSIDTKNTISWAETAANYSYGPVTVTNDPDANTAALRNLDGRTGTGQNDYFLSFAVPFQGMVDRLATLGININANSTLTYVMGTATQANSFNQDLNGVNGNTNSTTTWSSLGVLTQPLTPNGSAVPQPPVNVVPAAQSMPANSSLVITGTSVSDFNGNLATTRLTAGTGTIGVSLAGGATISAGANNSGTLTLSGTQAQINAALASITYTPPAWWGGNVSISVLSTDTTNLADTDLFQIAVAPPPNRPPVAANDAATTAEDTNATITVLANDSDPDADTLTVSAATVPAAQGTVTINANGTLLFVPAANYNGPATISYTVSDGRGGTASASVSVTVTAVNDLPVAANDTGTMAEDTTANFNVRGNDTDADGDTLTVTGATVPAAQGTVTVNADGTLRFVPVANFNGTATITYTVSDGKGGTATAQLIVTVTPVNDLPVAVNDSATTPEDSSKVVAVLANDSDLDGHTLTITSATVPPAQGTVTINPDKTLLFTPAANFNGTATIAYSISDGNGGTASAQAVVTVTPVNDLPVAVNDAATTSEDTALNVNVLANDSDVDGDTLNVTSATVPAAQGTVTVNADKTLRFAPALNFNGAATISYAISDLNGGTAAAQAVIAVSAVNDLPVAANDTASTAEDIAKTISVLGNDSDADGDTLTVTGANVAAAQGAVTVNADGTLSFTPAANFNGTATITYTIADGKGGTASAQVTVTVTAVNDAPVASNDTAATPEDTAATISVLGNDSDADGDTLTVTSASVPAAQGAVSVNANGTLLFTPAPNFNGSATINYNISDGNGGAATAQVIVTVSPANDAPVAVNDAASTPEDTAMVLAVLVNDSDLDGDALTVMAATVPAALGSVVVNADGTITFTPVANFNGVATISYTISDGNGGTASAQAAVTVTSVNDAPVAVNDTATTPEDTGIDIDVLANDSDIDGDTLTVVTASVPPARGTVAVTASGMLRFVPAANYFGPATISYTISDGNGGNASAQVAVTVTSVNDAPVAQDDVSSTPEDTPRTVAVLANDSDLDGDTLSVTGANVLPAQGTVTVNADGTLLFTPALNFTGAATITYAIADGNGGSDSATLTITVVPVNDTPVASDDTTTTAEDTSKVIVVLTNDTDHDGDTLTVTGASVPAAQGTVTVNADGTLLFQPAANHNGSATIAYTISDGNGGTANARVFVTVTPVNDAPAALDDAAATAEETAKLIDVLANDSDADGDTLSITGATVAAAQGTVAVNADGTLLFTPAADFNGVAAITYSISDGNGGAATAQVLVTVTAVNDAPVAINDSATTAEDTAKTIAVLANDTDPENDALAVTTATVAPEEGTVSVNLDGTLLFTPALNFSGAATIAYSISDGNGGAASALVAVTVTPVNDAPVALDDTSATPEDTAKVIDALANDSDVDGDALSITSASVPAAQGTVAVNADGTLLFTPAANFTGAATISYSINDGNGGAAAAQVLVTVTTVNDAPVAVNDSATTAEDTARVVNVLGNDTDPENDTLSVAAASVAPEEGAVAINPDGTLLFTPALNFNGTATIAYTISDGNGGSASAVAAVTVTPVNDAPVALDDVASTEEKMPKVINVLGNDNDVDGDALTVTSANVAATAGTVVINPDGTLLFTPELLFNGTAVISYSISDGKGGTATAQVTVEVLPVNDPPVAFADSGATPEDTAVDLVVLTNDSDPDGDALVVSGATVAPEQGTVTVNANNTVRFVPAPNFNGTATITYTITDGRDGSASALVTVTVTAVNDAPVALDDLASTTEDTAVTITVLTNDADPDGDTLTVTGATVPAAQGTVAVNGDGTLLFTPALNLNGTATIAYTIADGNNGTDTANVIVTVGAVNDAPLAVDDATSTPEDTAKTVAVLANDTDPESDTLSVTSATVAAAEGTVLINADGTLLFMPALNFNGTATIAYAISDGNGGAASARAVVTVTALNDPPTAVNDSASTLEDTAVDIDVLANDTDVEDDPLTVTTATVPAAQGTVTVNANGTLRFVPALNFNGPATVSYSISDENGGTASAQALVSVTSVNDAPVAVDDAASTPEDTATTVTVLGNDTDPENDTLTVTTASVPATEGTVTINADGTLLFTPALNFNGAAEIAYTISDGNGGTASARAIVTVTAVNDAPIAVNDTASTPEDTAVDVDVLANDSDIEGDTLTVTTATVPAAQGVVTINANGTLRFVPALNFSGPATISYSISDGKAGTASAVATVNVTPVNDAPVAVNDTATTPEDTATDIAVLANDTDPENDALSIVTASVPAAQGAVTVNADGTLRFTPALNFTGAAVIAYTITDGQGGNASAQATVTITPVNDAPTAVNDLASTFKNTAVDINALANDSDIEGDALAITTATVPAAQGVVTINADGTLHFVPANNFKGQALIAYSIADAQGGTASAQVQVTVYDTNAPPIAVDDTATTPEDTARIINVVGNDSDPDDDPLIVSNASVPASQGTVSVNADGTLFFTPSANFNGAAQISYTITDLVGATASAFVNVTVTPVNDAPLAVDDLASTLEDTAANISALVNDSDVDGDPLTITTATVAAAQGAVTINADGTLRFVPALNFNGAALVSYTISDGKGGTASANVTVSVNAVNDAPVAVDDSTATPEDVPKVVAVLANDSDVENDPLTVTSASVAPAQGSVTVNADGTLLFSPAQDFNGTATIAYSISDGKGGAASAQAIVSVTPVNDAPVAVNDLASTPEKTAVIVAVLANDSDLDQDALTVTSATVDPAQGSAVRNADGTVTFAPAVGFNGSAVINYAIADGNGGTATALVTVTVTASNDAPVAADDSAATAEDTAATINVLGNDTDADGDTLSVTAATVPAAQGAVSINADGTLLFTPAADYNGLALISYSIGDGRGGAASAQVTVTVTPVNDNPVAVDDAASTPEETPVDVSVLANDTDPENNALTVTDATVPPEQGAVTINADNTVRFKPAFNFNGVATIAYSIADGQGGVASAQAVVTVGAVNDGPIAADDLAATTGQDAVIVNVAANDTDPENDELTVQSATVIAGAGTVEVVDASNLRFTAALGFHGLAVIEYIISDPAGSSAKAILRVYVNAPPQAAPDFVVTQRNTAATISVLANDADADLTDVLTITSVSVDPAFGTAQRSADLQQVIFTPAAGLVGNAQLTYTITDGRGGFAQSTISVTIADGTLNQPPLPITDRTTTAPATPVSIAVLANDTDPDNDALTLQSATVSAAQGTVTVSGPSVSFQPAAGFTGAANIRYTVSDSQGNTAQAIAIVEVTAGNEPPIARDDTGKAASGTPKIFVVARNDIDPENDPLQVQSITVVTPGAGTAVVNSDGTVTYTPAPAFTGIAQLTYVIADPSGATSQASLTIEVLATVTNTAPVTENDTASTRPEQPVTIYPLANDRDAEGDILTVKTATVPPEQGTITIEPDGSVIFTPAPGFTGVARIDYIAIDPEGGETPGIITVLVNTPPIANPDIAKTGANQQLTLNVLTNDTDADGHALAVVTHSLDATQGTLTINAAGQLTFTPAANISGPATFTYIVEDELQGQSGGIIQITVNDPPVAVDSSAQTDIETPITLNVLSFAQDPNGDPLEVVAAAVDAAQGTVTIQDDGTLLFTPASTFTGPALVHYLVADKWGEVASATVSITRGNAQPHTSDRLVYAFCGVPLNINALRGAIDADGDTLTILSVTQPKTGRVKILPDGRVVFRPGLSYNDPTTKDSFTVTVSDSKGGISKLTIRVASFNSFVGAYMGLVTNSADGAVAGRVNVVMGNAATFSGYVQYGTQRAPFIGRLGSRLDSTLKLKIAGYPQAKLQLAFSVDTQTFSGEISGVGPDTHTIGVARRVVKRLAGGAPVLGKYRADVAVHGASDPLSPVGDLLVKVNASGFATLTGYLPDGRVFTSSTGVFANGQIPIYRAYGPSGASSGGYVAGFILLNPAAPAAPLAGTLDAVFGAPGQLELMPPTP